MLKNIDRQIILFTEGTGLTDRAEMVHGTLYVKMKEDRYCDFFHKELRNFMRKFINVDTGVNLFLVGDEFCFDFVPEKDEHTSNEEFFGVPAEEPLGSKIDTMLELENEMNWGK